MTDSIRLPLSFKHTSKNEGCIGESLREYQRKQKREFVKLIYRKAQTELELNTIFEPLKIA